MSDILLEDMYKAYIDCRKNKRNKVSTIKFEVNALYNIQKLCFEINTRSYKLRPAECFIVKDPRLREVFCANFRDRVVQHFVYNELNPCIENMLIFDAANCRKGKGTDFAIDRVSRFLIRETENYNRRAFYLKVDISGFFMNIDRLLLLDKVRNIIWNIYEGIYKAELDYLAQIICLSDVTKNCIRISPISDWEQLPAHKTLFGNKNGLPIGNICSQLFANLYLNNIDHIIKARHKSYSRYVDDFVIVDRDRNKLKQTLKIISKQLSYLGLSINSKTKITDVKYGIEYLGIVIKPHYRFLGKSRIGRMYKAICDFDTPERTYARVASRKGMFKRYHGYRFMRNWYSNFPEKVKSKLKIKSGFDFSLWE